MLHDVMICLRTCVRSRGEVCNVPSLGLSLLRFEAPTLRILFFVTPYHD